MNLSVKAKTGVGLVTGALCVALGLAGCSVGGGTQSVTVNTGDSLQVSWGDGWQFSDDASSFTKQGETISVRYMTSDDFDRNVESIANGGSSFSNVSAGTDPAGNGYVDATYSNGTSYRLIWVKDSSTGILLSATDDDAARGFSALSFKCADTQEGQDKADEIAKVR